MSCMCQDIAQIQLETAAMPTGELRHAIYHSLDLMDMALESMRHHCLSTSADGSAEEQAAASRASVLMHTLLVALYVRELTRRPAPPSFSLN
jgi:hypothetical protein